MDKVAELEKRIDRVHSDIKRNPSMRADFAPFLRELEAELSAAIESEAAYRAEKQDFSRKPWRVLDETGAQVWRKESFNHPNLGMIVIDGPVCFDRKRDAVAWIAAERA